MPDCIITLSIQETGAADARGFLFHVLIDGQPVASNQSLTPEQAKQLRQLSQQFNQQFESRYQPQATTDNLMVIGAELFKLWLADAWDRISAAVPAGGANRTLLIASEAADVLNLPWELLRLPGKDFIAFDQKFNISRLPRAENELPKSGGALPAGPLRVLFAACSPLDEAPLDYKKEEESLVRVMAKAGSNVVFDSGDMGSYEELQERLNQFDPHVVYLTGHGIVKEDGLGYFCFEDERGQTDLRSSKQLRALFAGSSVQCVFVSGCQTGKAPPISALGGICQGLVSEEVPFAIGWAASIADTVATEFATSFFKTLAAGQPIGRAMNQARQAIRKTCDEMGYPAWTLPVMYAASSQTQLFDPQRQEKSRRPNLRLHPLPGMVEGYAEHFVGRRREIQRLLPALREGSKQVVLLTGIGGAGKSTLATRLARKVESDGFAPIAISSTENNPLTGAQLLQTCGDAFLKKNLSAEVAVLNNPELSVPQRLRYVINTLNEHRFVLVLDNFEVNLDEITRRVLNPEVAEFYSHLLSNLVGDSRALVTCRYLPAGTGLPSTAHEEALGDFPEAQFVKLLLREPELEKRYYAGDLPQKLLRQLHELLGGTPRFLIQMREAIKTMTTAELWQELETVKLPAPVSNEDAPAKLQKLREAYCQRIFTARLFSYLGEDSQRALCRAAVFGVPVNLAGLAAVSGESETRLRELTRQWQNHALAFPEREKADGELWAVYGLLRGWMLSQERLPEADRLAAHKTAGDFLKETVDENHVAELGLSGAECLAEAREQYLEASELASARKITYWLSFYLVRSALYAEVIRLNSEMLSREEHPSPMIWIGRVFLETYDYPKARKWYQQALKIAGDKLPKESAEALAGLASIYLNECNYPAAREMFNRSLGMQKQIGNHAEEAVIWHQLGLIDLEESKYPAAKEKFNHSLEIKQQIGDRVSEANTWHNLVSIDLKEGNYQAAKEKSYRLLALRQQIGDRVGEASTWNQLATIDSYEGNYPAAREKLYRSLEMHQQTGRRAGEANIWRNLATIDLCEGNYLAAREKFYRSLEMHQQIGDRAGEANTWCDLALIDVEESNYPAAKEKLNRSLELQQQIGNRDHEALTFNQVGVIAHKQGRLLQAARLAALSFGLLQAIGHNNVRLVWKNLIGMAGQLNYTQEQFDVLRAEVAQEYARDRGAGLVRAAFGEE